MFYNASKQQTECIKLIFKTKMNRTFQQTTGLIQLHSTDVNEDYRLAAPPKNINILFVKFFKICLNRQWRGRRLQKEVCGNFGCLICKRERSLIKEWIVAAPPGADTTPAPVHPTTLINYFSNFHFLVHLRKRGVARWRDILIDC